MCSQPRYLTFSGDDGYQPFRNHWFNIKVTLLVTIGGPDDENKHLALRSFSLPISLGRQVYSVRALDRTVGGYDQARAGAINRIKNLLVGWCLSPDALPVTFAVPMI
jgi:hypothetical protein